MNVQTKDGNEIHLTENEVKMIKAFADNEFSCGNVESDVWSFAICDDFPNRSGAGVLGSLVKKELASCWTEEKGGDELTGLTVLGVEVYDLVQNPLAQ